MRNKPISAYGSLKANQHVGMLYIVVLNVAQLTADITWMRAFLLVETPHPWGMGRDNGDRWGSTETARWWLLCCTEVESKWSATGLYLLEPSLYALGLYRVERGHIEGWWCSGYQGLWWIKMGRFETTEMNPCIVSADELQDTLNNAFGAILNTLLPGIRSSMEEIDFYAFDYRHFRVQKPKKFMTALCQGYLLLNKDKRLSIGLQHFWCGKNNSSLGLSWLSCEMYPKLPIPTAGLRFQLFLSIFHVHPEHWGNKFNLTCAYFQMGGWKNTNPENGFCAKTAACEAKPFDEVKIWEFKGWSNPGETSFYDCHSSKPEIHFLFNQNSYFGYLFIKSTFKKNGHGILGGSSRFF